MVFLDLCVREASVIGCNSSKDFCALCLSLILLLHSKSNQTLRMHSAPGCFCHPALLHNSSAEPSRRQQHKETHEGHRSCLPVGLDPGWTAWRRDEALTRRSRRRGERTAPGSDGWRGQTFAHNEPSRASRTLEEKLFWDGGTARTDIQRNPAISRSGFTTNTVLSASCRLSPSGSTHTNTLCSCIFQSAVDCRYVSQ